MQILASMSVESLYDNTQDSFFTEAENRGYILQTKCDEPVTVTVSGNIHTQYFPCEDEQKYKDMIQKKN